MGDNLNSTYTFVATQGLSLTTACEAIVSIQEYLEGESQNSRGLKAEC